MLTEELVWAVIDGRVRLPWGLVPSLHYNREQRKLYSATVTFVPWSKASNGVYARLGDWIARDEHGECRPIPDFYFRSRYELRDTPPASELILREKADGPLSEALQQAAAWVTNNRALAVESGMAEVVDVFAARVLTNYPARQRAAEEAEQTK